MLRRFFVCREEDSSKAEALTYLEAKTRNGKSNGISMRRFMQACVVCVLAVVMLGAEPSSRFNKVGHQMMCACGCGQVLLECKPCGVSGFGSDDWGVADADCCGGTRILRY